MPVKKGGMKKTSSKGKTAAPPAYPDAIGPGSFARFEKDLKNLSEQELRELLMINMYKMALLRAQLETVNNVLIRARLTTYEEIWKDTNENFRNSI